MRRPAAEPVRPRSPARAVRAPWLAAVLVTAGCRAPLEETGNAAIDEELRAELLAMRDRDQELRHFMAEKYRVSGSALDPEDAERWMEVDSANTARLEEIVDARGWPGRALVGEEGARAAFLLAQHADHAPAFQERCLGLLRAAVAAEDADPADLAYLTDRVLLKQDRPQVYGTQVEWVDSEPRPLPLEDPEHVDERRAAVGLGPLAEYLRRFADG